MDPIQPARKSLRYEWIVVLFASAVFLTGVISPPWLMDNVDATQAVMARNILLTGDWVSFRCDGVLYLEKAPLKYWMTAVSYLIFGEHDWVARLPIALSTIALCWLAVRMGRWAISPEAGFYSGLFLSTCIGLYLFTRTTIPDVVLTLSIAMSLYGFLRALDAEERRPRAWAYLLWAGLAAGVLLKGLIGLLFPVGAAVTYLAFSRQLFDRQAWRRLYPLTGFLIFFAIASPWHVLAILRNPPYFDFSLHSGPGQYRGFFWFYFINEHLLRFLNLRYPRDYNTVPRVYFWLLNLAWLFPWSVYLPKVARLSYRPASREGRMHLLALCWIGFVMVFFTFSTTQEYYSMPIYPALALLLGSGVASADGRGSRRREDRWRDRCVRGSDSYLALYRGAKCGRAWRYFRSAEPERHAGRLFARSKSYSRSYRQRHGLSKGAAGDFGVRVHGWRDRRVVAQRETSRTGDRRNDGAVPRCGAPGAGGV